MIRIDLYPKRRYRWMKTYDFTEVNGKYGKYYYIKVKNGEEVKILKKARRNGIKYRYYDENWSRSGTYRRKFLRVNKPPYRCRYCNRSINEKNLIVDHLVPIGMTKKSGFMRWFLKYNGIDNINDVRNLVPSCYRCNSRKGDRLGLWFLKGILGKYKVYWIIRRIIITILLCTLVYLLYTNKIIDVLLFIKSFFLEVVKVLFSTIYSKITY